MDDPHKLKGSARWQIQMDILHAVAFIVLFAYFAFRATNTDPRFSGFRLAGKGGMVFFVSWFVLGRASCYESLSFIRTLGVLLAIVGLLMMIIGSIRQAKIMLSPDEFDARRGVDPGYDLPYQLCPDCEQVEIRMTRRKMKCPHCGATIKI